MTLNDERTAGADELAPGSPGRMFVELIAGAERRMHAAAHAYPAVDHLAPHPGTPTVAQLDTLHRQLAEWASPPVQSAFARWRQAGSDLDAAVHALEELHADSHEREPDFQSRLEERIHALREAKVALTDAAESLHACVAAEIDAAIIRGGLG